MVSSIKKRRALPLVALGAALALVTAACSNGGGESAGSGGGDGNSTLAKVQKAGELRYGVIPGEPPGFIQEGGEWHGYCAEIAQEIAKQLNLKPVPVETTWGNMALDLKTDKIDLAVCAQPTGERALVVDYTTHPIYTNYYTLIVRDDGPTIEKWSDLNKDGLNVGAQTGDATIEPVKSYAPKAKTTFFQTREQGLLALQAGRIDAEAQTLLNGLQAVKSRKDFKGKIVVPEPLIAAPSAAMVKRSADQSLLHAVDTVVWNLNSSGWNRTAILKALSEYGITAADLPPNAAL
jgi:polar amino acid transport system substrate-binding protein